MAALLELEGVSFRPGGRAVLDSIDLRLGAWPVCALVGPNGSGKTVSLRIAHGLLKPDSGQVRFEGKALPAGDVAFAGQALVFQHPSMFRGSVLDNLMLARHGLPTRKAQFRKAQFRRKALEILERVGLAALADAPALKLSGGERQRVALARAWLTNPRLLLLDEPTASLDPVATDSIERLIGEIAASGCRVLMSSHNLGQIARLADEVVFIGGGRLLERAPTAEFFGAPRSGEARRYLQGELPWQLASPVPGSAEAPIPETPAPEASVSC